MRLWITLRRNRWFRRFSFLILAVFLICLLEIGHFTWKVVQVKNRVNEVSSIQDRFLEANLETTCPRSKYKTYYSCFREGERELISRSHDSTGTILLLSVGVMASMLDKSKHRSNEQDVSVNLVELTIDLVEPLVKNGRPSQWSILISDHLERSMQLQFYSSMVLQTDSLMQKTADKLKEGKNQDTFHRFQSIQTRYEELKPIIQKYQKENYLIGRLL
jgi:hypothetical protein